MKIKVGKQHLFSVIEAMTQSITIHYWCYIVEEMKIQRPSSYASCVVGTTQSSDN